MKAWSRIVRRVLVLVLIVLVGQKVYPIFFPSSVDQPSSSKPNDDEILRPNENDIARQARKPSPQDIVRLGSGQPPAKRLTIRQAASMNTLWDPWDEEHCSNICAVSWTACQMRHCDDYFDMEKQEL